MKIITNVELVEKTTMTYIAEDGTTFPRNDLCEEYEKTLSREDKYSNINKLLVVENYPPCDGGENYENDCYKWFLVNNDTELNLINDFFETNAKCESYPEYISIEYDAGNNGYSQTLANCKEYVVELFGKLGFDVDFKRHNY